MATFHNFFRTVTITDASVLAWLNTVPSGMPKETIWDMLDYPPTALWYHIMDMMDRGLVAYNHMGNVVLKSSE